MVIKHGTVDCFFVLCSFLFWGGGGVGIISGAIWGSFQGWGSFRGRDHFGGCTGFPIQTVAAVERCLNLNILNI